MRSKLAYRPIHSFSTNFVIPLCVVLASTSTYVNFLGGDSSALLWVPLAWVYTAIQSLTLGYVYKLRKPAPASYGIFLVLIVGPVAIQFAQDLGRLSLRRSAGAGVWEQLLILLFVLEIVLIAAGLMLVRAYATRAADQPMPSAVPEVTKPTPEPEVSARPTDGAPPSTEAHQFALGQNDGYIDRVIRSVLWRSTKSEGTANFSLNVMLGLVFVGGMASFGLWALTDADRINSLEAERNKLLALQADVKGLREELGPGGDDLKGQLDRVLRYIERNYQTSPTYEDTLKRLSLQSQTNVADIAIRVTIAVLTIFLVQVFFSVYKYNRHLAIMLAAKAEALELAGNDEDARKVLSREAVSIVKETVPGFGPAPRTVVGEAARVVEKLGK